MTDSPVKYLLFLQIGDAPDYESYFDDLDKAVEYAYFCWGRAHDCLAIASLDMRTGVFETIYDSRKLEHKMEQMEKYDEEIEWEEKCYGSYADQHRQTVRDVL